MTVFELSQKMSLNVIALPDPDRQISGGYVGDLLSWVMSRAQADEAWITIMSNQNVAAVAALTDVSCVIFAEGVKPDPDLLKKAEIQGINLLGTDLSSFALAAELSAVL